MRVALSLALLTACGGDPEGPRYSSCEEAFLEVAGVEAECQGTSPEAYPGDDGGAFGALHRVEAWCDQGESLRGSEEVFCGEGSDVGRTGDELAAAYGEACGGAAEACSGQ